MTEMVEQERQDYQAEYAAMRERIAELQALVVELEADRKMLLQALRGQIVTTAIQRELLHDGC